MIYKVQIKNFEGPLDLLLYFIRRDELDIYDIPIAKITKDFIAVIEEWKRANLVVAGDFIVMASTLMRVKAKMMLPRPELDEDGEILDPREELMQQLIDYKRFRDASDILKKMSIERSYNVARQFEQEISINKGDDLEIYFKDVTLYDLARKFKEAIDSKPVISQFELNNVIDIKANLLSGGQKKKLVIAMGVRELMKKKNNGKTKLLLKSGNWKT